MKILALWSTLHTCSIHCDRDDRYRKVTQHGSSDHEVWSGSFRHGEGTSLRLTLDVFVQTFTCRASAMMSGECSSALAVILGSFWIHTAWEIWGWTSWNCLIFARDVTDWTWNFSTGKYLFNPVPVCIRNDTYYLDGRSEAPAQQTSEYLVGEKISTPICFDDCLETICVRQPQCQACLFLLYMNT